MDLHLAPVRGGSWSRLRVMFRIAGRDIRRHRGRSALIVALIALPVCALSALATVGYSTVATPAETVRQELGQTQGRLSTVPGQNSHTVQGSFGDIGSLSYAEDPEPDFRPARLQDAVPRGFDAHPWREYTLTTPVLQAQVPVRTIAADVLNPLFEGRMRLLSGQAPERAGEVLASPGLLKRFDRIVGDTLETSAGQLRLVGTVRDATAEDSAPTLYLHQDQIPLAIAAAPLHEALYLSGDQALGWAQARELNAVGITLTSAALMNGVSPPAEIAAVVAELDAQSNPWARFTSILGLGSLVSVLALLEVGLLAGAAFAVGARKQQRDLALLAASGAEGATLRGTVTASGMWLGLAGGILGAAIGTLAGIAVVALMHNAGSTRFPGIHILWPVSVGLILVGVAAGVIAALVPARAVARSASLAALKSGQPVQGAPRGSLWMGAILVSLAAVMMLGAWVIAHVTSTGPHARDWQPWSFWLVAGGAVVLVVGFIFWIGPLLTLLTKRSSRLPVAMRLASRDALRNRGRAVPAVAAVLAAATLSGALLVGAATTSLQAEENHQWEFPEGTGGIALEWSSYDAATAEHTIHRAASAESVAAITRALGAESSPTVLRGSPLTNDCAEGAVCASWTVAIPSENRCETGGDDLPLDTRDWRCTSRLGLGSSAVLPELIVGGERELRAVLGHAPSAEALRALSTGGMVLTQKALLTAEGTANVVSYDHLDVENYPTSEPEADGKTYRTPNLVALKSTAIPAVVDAPVHDLSFAGVLSPEAAQRVGLPVADRAVVFQAPAELSAQECDILQAQLRPAMGDNVRIYIERGPAGNIAGILWLVVLGSALISLSAAGITAGLALADGRHDHATLAAIGASTRLRRSLAAAGMLLTAVLGTLLGLIAGAIPMTVLFLLTRGASIAVPWLQMGAMLLVVPLFGAAAAWLLTRGKLPLARRQTLA